MLAVLALGSNVGERHLYLENAVIELKKNLSVLEKTKIKETEPIGPKQAKFLNQLILIDTILSPLELLELVKNIEKYLGRKWRFHWGPREIDIDILFYEGVQMETETLCIPHKEIKNREFIQELLEELANTSKFDISSLISLF